MSEQERTFTVEQAGAELPDLRERLPRIREARQQVFASSRRIRGRVASDGGGADGREYWDAVAVLRAELEHLAGRGIILRDPETGLVDFPADMDGRRVFLCWRMGEERVGYWHDPESGFSGRRPL
jgi:hypothetical protein